jgi:hypothetical protein
MNLLNKLTMVELKQKAINIALSLEQDHLYTKECAVQDLIRLITFLDQLDLDENLS